MRPVHRVSSLKADDGAPLALGEGGSRLCGRQAILREVIVPRERQHTHRPTEQHVTLSVNRREPRVHLVVSPIHLTALEPLVVPKLLLDLHDSEHAAGLVRKCDLAPLVYAVLLFGCDSQRDWHRPGKTRGQVHIADHSTVVPLSHEAVERAVAADGEQFEVRERSGREPDNEKRGSVLAEGIGLRAADEQVDKRAAVGFVRFCRGRFVQRFGPSGERDAPAGAPPYPGSWLLVPASYWCSPHSLYSGFSHHQRPARMSSPGLMARVHGAQPMLG